MSIRYILRNSIGKSYRIPRYIRDRQNYIGFTYNLPITYLYLFSVYVIQIGPESMISGTVSRPTYGASDGCRKIRGNNMSTCAVKVSLYISRAMSYFCWKIIRDLSWLGRLSALLNIWQFWYNILFSMDRTTKKQTKN